MSGDRDMGCFIQGLDLCEGFFHDVIEPILDDQFPSLQYTAGLIGYGSDVLGFDDEVSTDHMWGPRLYLFLIDADKGLTGGILSVLSRNLPYEYKGYSVNFSEPDPDGGGVRYSVPIACGTVSPLIHIHTVSEYLGDYLGVSDLTSLTELDWLAFSEHRLLALTSGRIFADDLGLDALLGKLRFYPKEVKLFLIASNWSMIAEEQAFVKRCSDVGDEIGSILVCARIAERLMRLAFLYCEQYAPYSKWFGTSFGRLPIDESIESALQKAVTAASISDRETYIVLAQKLLADLHNSLKITEFVDVRVEDYFGRDIKVIFADKICRATAGQLRGTPLEAYPLIGSVSEVANFVTLSDCPRYAPNIKALYAT